ncbi:hypothetical protein HG530_014384 [Fusarium avenaceum]|nr:hypothetical protein HG530_014384 [Fusarium avenaceum]
MAKILGQVRVSAKLFTSSLQGSFDETLVAELKDDTTLRNNGGEIFNTLHVMRHLEAGGIATVVGVVEDVFYEA